jgi:hypothetical protein
MIYLASPYSAKDPDGVVNEELQCKRYIDACAAVGLLMKKGELVYSPIVHWHIVDQMYKGEIGYEDYLACDCAMIELCSEVHVLQIDGWDKSRGVAVEILYAQKFSKPVKYLTMSEEGLKYVSIS